jgi:NADH-quinone oxidoreductase subunit E
MAVRRLHPDQPASFAFTPDNLAWVQQTIAKYPDGKAASAVVPVLWRAQEQIGGWITEPAIRTVADMLGMAYIRVYEIATFYTMFQLAPIGSKAHVQVCGTTPCMLRGSGDLIKVCKSRIASEPHHVSADGAFSWEEVECLGSCANAPMVQIDKDTYEDLTAAKFEQMLDAIAAGRAVPPGSQTGRKASCPDGGATSLKDSALYDGSRIGAWQRRFAATAAPAASSAPVSAPAPVAAPAPAATAPASAATAAAPQATTAPQPHPAALAAIANAGLVKELEARGSKPMPAAELASMAAIARVQGPAAFGAKPIADAAAITPSKPELLSAPRGGAGDDLKLIWGVAEKLEQKMYAMGIWHYDQIAKWTPAEIAWFENEIPGFHGRIARDKWIEQCEKLSNGWRPEGNVGERPKG